MTRPSLALTALALLLSAASTALALGFEETLARADSRPAAITARLDLIAAQNSLIRVEGDPFALKIDRLQAEQAVELSRATFEQAYYQALLDIADAYAGVLEARHRLALAERGMALAEASVRIAEIRRDNGGATALDVEDARIALENARKNTTLAASALRISENNLEGMIGEELVADDLESVPDRFLIEVPSEEATLQAIDEHPDLMGARHGLALADLGVKLLDPSYASEQQIEAAETQLETTRELVQEARRGFDLQARNLVIRARNAVETYEVEKRALAAADERLALQREQLDAGRIAAIQYDQAELDRFQAELAALEARHGVVRALLELQAGTLVALDGLEGLDFATATGIAVSTRGTVDPATDSADGR